MSEYETFHSDSGSITLQDVKSIKTIFGSHTPGILQHIVILLSDDITTTLLHGMNANDLYQAIVAERPEIIEEWRTRTGIDQF